MATLNQVNAALKNAGAEEILVKGNGYFYFTEGNAHAWEEAGVYGIFRLNDLTIRQWVSEWSSRNQQYLESL